MTENIIRALIFRIGLVGFLSIGGFFAFSINAFATHGTLSEDKGEDIVFINALETDITRDELERCWAHLESVGLVDQNADVPLVTITTTANYSGDYSDEELMEESKGKAVSVHLNEDKSITFVMNQEQYFDFLMECSNNINKSFVGCIDNDKNTVEDVIYASDYSEFRIHVKGTEINSNDKSAAFLFAAYGTFMRAISGEDKDENIIIHYLDSEENLIETINSEDLNIIE